MSPITLPPPRLWLDEKDISILLNQFNRMLGVQRSWLNIQFFFCCYFLLFLQSVHYPLDISCQAFSLLYIKCVSFHFILCCSVCVCVFFLFFSSSSIVVNLVVSTKWNKNEHGHQSSTGGRAFGWRYEFLIHFRINLHFGRHFKL